MRRPPRERTGSGRRRGLGAAALIAGAAALLAAGWGLAAVFESPQQREAHASPPPPGDILAEVRRGDLADTVTVNIEVTRAARLDVPLATSDGLAVVTGRPVPDGGRLLLLEPVIEVNGRPVILITGKFPMYRELAEGAEGPDIRQLQRALDAGGYHVAADGRYGRSTVLAVERLFGDLGYPPPASLAPGDLIVVPRLPAQLIWAPRLGAGAADQTVRIAAGRLVGAVDVPAGIAQRLAPGMPVGLRAADGTDVDARIDAIGDIDPETADARLTVVPVEGAFDPEVLGATMLATIRIELVEVDALLVPSVALTPRGASDPVVVRVGADGRHVEVRVRELASLAGISAVEPVGGGSLRPGDRVKVG